MHMAKSTAETVDSQELEKEARDHGRKKETQTQKAGFLEQMSL